MSRPRRIPAARDEAFDLLPLFATEEVIGALLLVPAASRNGGKLHRCSRHAAYPRSIKRWAVGM
jgi:hypothetical protein